MQVNLLKLLGYLQSTHFLLDFTLHTVTSGQDIPVVDQAAAAVNDKITLSWNIIYMEYIKDPSASRSSVLSLTIRILK